MNIDALGGSIITCNERIQRPCRCICGRDERPFSRFAEAAESLFKGFLLHSMQLQRVSELGTEKLDMSTRKASRALNGLSLCKNAVVTFRTGCLK